MVVALSQLQQNHQETKLHLRFWIVTLLFELIQKRKQKKKSFYEILKKTMGFCWFLDLQGNVIMKYLRKKNLKRSREQTGSNSWGQDRR